MIRQLHLAALFAIRYALSPQKSLSVASRYTLLGLTVAIAVLYIAQILMSSMDVFLREQILRFVPHSVIHVSENAEEDPRILELHQKVANVNSISPIRIQGVTLISDKLVATTGLIGSDPERFAQAAEYSTVMGSDFKQALTSHKFPLILGDVLASRLRVTLGDTVTGIFLSERTTLLGRLTKQQQFVVSGILDTNTSLDDIIAQTTASSLLRLNPNADLAYIAQLDDPDALEQTLPGIYEHLDNVDIFGYSIDTWQRQQQPIFDYMDTLRQIFTLILALMVGIACVNVVSTAMMFLQERQSDIAILKTCGAGSFQIAACFVFLCTTYVLTSVAMASIVAWLASLGLVELFPWLMEYLQLDTSQFLVVTSMNFELAFDDWLMVLGVALSLAVISAIYPALQAARLPPADSLRFE